MHRRSLLTIALSLTLAAHAYAYQEVDKVDGGTLTGTVKTKHAASKATKPVTKDQATCGQTQPDETYVVGKDGGFANVVVFLDGISQGKKIPNATVVVENAKCRFSPHVTAYAVGTKLTVGNSDQILHNTHTYMDGNTVFNFALPMKGTKASKTVEEAGVIKFGCDVGHTWMSAWSYVTEHPYVVVTDKDGKFTMADIPPGEYTVKTWHEAAGSKTGKVTITKGGTATFDLSY